MKKLTAILHLESAVLAQALQIEGPIVVESATVPIDQPGVLKVRISGAGFWVRNGHPVPPAYPTVYDGSDGSDPGLEWHFDSPNEVDK